MSIFKLRPVHNAVGYFFKNENLYYIPKYQRSYAWDNDEVSAFTEDLTNCFLARKNHTTQNHFFGGIVSVEHDIPGTQGYRYEIIDGQQRMVTFTLLVVTLIEKYNELIDSANPTSDDDNVEFIKKRIAKFTNRFIEINVEINRSEVKHHVVELSKLDNDYYKLITSFTFPRTISAHSHFLLNQAYHKIKTTISEIAQYGNPINLSGQMDNLEKVHQIIDIDFSILHMITENKDDAYTLFQVLNNRGKSLTEGDLLRAKTLELLESYPTEQAIVNNTWNEILTDKPTETHNYLKWIFASVVGRSAKNNNFYQDFLENLFPVHSNSPISSSDATSIKNQTIFIMGEVEKCRNVVQGIWPFPNQQPIEFWDRNRLTVLIKELKHILAMPILIAASQFNDTKFRDLVSIIDRFVFRYVYMCNQHATPVGKIYMQEAVKIRADSDNYNLADLNVRLKALQDQKAPDSIFESALDNLFYTKKGKSNKPLKYLLINCEYYYRWFNDGATGTPTCLDKSYVYSFPDATIEHIYPRSAKGSTINSNLEAIKDSLGNLTILGSNDNVTGANDNFITKKPIYSSHSGKINSIELAGKSTWTQVEVAQHKTLLKDITKAVFKLS